jgi:hypothetical protein
MPKISRFRAIDIAFSCFRPTDCEGENAKTRWEVEGKKAKT